MTKGLNMNEISQSYLKSKLQYNHETGIFVWLKNNKRAGFTHSSGYRRIKLKNHPVTEHRLVWLYIYGYIPEQVDHINGNRSDNRLKNLRQATNQQNQQNKRTPSSNNKSGYLGVSLCKKSKKWKATISINNISITIGYYDCPQKAHDAYLTRKRQVHGFCTI